MKQFTFLANGKLHCPKIEKEPPNPKPQPTITHYYVKKENVTNSYQKFVNAYFFYLTKNNLKSCERKGAIIDAANALISKRKKHIEDITKELLDLSWQACTRVASQISPCQSKEGWQHKDQGEQ